MQKWGGVSLNVEKADMGAATKSSIINFKTTYYGSYIIGFALFDRHTIVGWRKLIQPTALLKLTDQALWQLYKIGLDEEGF